MISLNYDVEPNTGEVFYSGNTSSVRDADNWITRDGKVLTIKDMTTEHIKNTIRKFGSDRVPKCMLKEYEARTVLKQKFKGHQVKIVESYKVKNTGSFDSKKDAISKALELLEKYVSNSDLEHFTLFTDIEKNENSDKWDLFQTLESVKNKDS
jgi:hypothetical protein